MASRSHFFFLVLLALVEGVATEPLSLGGGDELPRVTARARPASSGEQMCFPNLHSDASANTHGIQLDSPGPSFLPADLRLRIYLSVFFSSFSLSLDKETHSLSLLTKRRTRAA